MSTTTRSILAAVLMLSSLAACEDGEISQDPDGVDQPVAQQEQPVADTSESVIEVEGLAGELVPYTVVPCTDPEDEIPQTGGTLRSVVATLDVPSKDAGGAQRLLIGFVGQSSRSVQIRSPGGGTVTFEEPATLTLDTRGCTFDPALITIVQRQGLGGPGTDLKGVYDSIASTVTANVNGLSFFTLAQP